MERSEEKEYEHLTRQERERFDRWEVGQKLHFPQENKDLGMKAGEVARVEKMDRKTGVITLRKENGQEAKLVPEHTKREMEKKALEEKTPEQKVMEQGKEERKEEKKEVSKEQDRSREKDPFQDRPEERPERRQEQEREEKKEVRKIERQRERGRGGMGY